MPESSRPEPVITGRTAVLFSRTCHVIHVALVAFVLTGWLIPLRDVLVAHLVFVPALILTWLLNRNTCPLNNLESRLLRGVWRNEENREEGSFLLVLVESYLHLHPTQRAMDAITYALMGFCWLLSVGHLSLLG